MSRKYPRVGKMTAFKPKQNHKCQICGERASHNVTVEWWWMRGDDDVYRLCQSHVAKVQAGDFKIFEGEKAKESK